MHREINLSGGEITLLKTMGLSGAPVYGKLLVERIGEMDSAEFLDELDVSSQDAVAALDPGLATGTPGGACSSARKKCFVFKFLAVHDPPPFWVR